MFYVGQMVVCVDDSTMGAPATPDEVATLKGLVRGHIYTVRRVEADWPFRTGPNLGVWLEEICRNWLDFSDLPFDAVRFRPVRTTSIDCFTALLAPTPKQRVTA